MIRCGADENIERLVLQGLAEILHAFGLPLLAVAHRFDGPGHRILGDVADIGNLHVRLGHEALDQPAAATVDAHHADG